MLTITLYAKQKKRHRCTDKLLDSVGEGEGGMFRENSIETSILSVVKQITSPGWMHETSARAWCTGKTQRDRVEFHSFLRLRSIPQCVHITSSLFTRLLMDTLCASIL